MTEGQQQLLQIIADELFGMKTSILEASDKDFCLKEVQAKIEANNQRYYDFNCWLDKEKPFSGMI